ncbi:MAG TPA: DinB family protein [Gemmatimonadaceae bacterium]|nr:DinB family protein [Gemmatimonadaceae bacterium]
MSSSSPDPLRALLQSSLNWQDAHVNFDGATADLPAELRGARVPGILWSPWQLLEHMRRVQNDIVDFCVNSAYEEKVFPDDYWPPSIEPPSATAWDESIAAFRADLAKAQEIAADASIDLSAKIPHGTGQTYARELVLIVDHTAYHVGQLVMLRRALGAWTAS